MPKPQTRKKQWRKTKARSSIQYARHQHKERRAAEEDGRAFLCQVFKRVGQCAASLMAAVCITSLIMYSTPLQAETTNEQKQHHTNRLTDKTNFNIPQHRADIALTLFAEQANLTLVFPFESVREKQANQLVGQYSLKEAIAILLNDTGLTPSFSDQWVLTIDINHEGMGMNRKKTLLAATVAFFAGGGVPAVVAQEPAADDGSGWLLEEVVVTANKRSAGQGIQDTAMAISVVSSETIENRGLVSAGDYLATIPGVSFTELGATDKKIVIRGLSNGSVRDEKSVGTYLGEIPLGTGTFDVKLVDIERVEVLKGPQGTLYGSDAFSGIVRNVPVMPNLQEVEGSFKVDASAQSESDDFNNSVVGVLNVPLVSDQLAVRVTAYRYDNAGYVDAISTPLVESVAASTGSTVIVDEDMGGSTFTGARATLLWNASDNMDVSLMLGTQDVEVDGTSETLRGLGSYQASILNRSPGKQEDVDFDYANLVVDYDLGWANLMSSTSLLEGDEVRGLNFFVNEPNDFLGPLSWDFSQNTETFAQEIRLASQLEGQLQFVVGLFYEDREQNNISRNDWEGSASTNPFAPDTLWVMAVRQLDLEQKALFGELSYAFNEQWELTVGTRYYDYDRIDISTSPVSAFDPIETTEELDSSKTGSTSKVNLSFTPNDNTLIYAQWSEGFRLGKGQVVPPAGLCDTDGDGKLDGTDADLVSQIDPDTTENIELGMKLTLLENRLTLNTAIFNIDWTDLPARVTSPSPECSSSITNNIGEANSLGIEIEANYLITPQLAMNLSASYVEAEWEDTTGIDATPGERLSFSPRTNAYLGLRYDFDVNTYASYLHTDISYVGEYETQFQSFNELPAGDYVSANMRLGTEINQWGISFYVKNLFNDDSSINSFVKSDYRVRPRRVGLEATYNF